MKRLIVSLIFVITLLLPSFTVFGQSGLNISKVFDGTHVADPEVTETIISGSHLWLKKYEVNLIHTFKGPARKFAAIIEPLIKADGVGTVGRNIQYKKGQLAYAFYILKPITSNGKDLNRYIYYLNNSTISKNSGGDVMIIYIEGSLDSDQVRRLIPQLTRK